MSNSTTTNKIRNVMDQFMWGLIDEAECMYQIAALAQNRRIELRMGTRFPPCESIPVTKREGARLGG